MMHSLEPPDTTIFLLDPQQCSVTLSISRWSVAGTFLLESFTIFPFSLPLYLEDRYVLIHPLIDTDDGHLPFVVSSLLVPVEFF